MNKIYLSLTVIVLFVFTMETSAYSLSDIINKKWHYVSEIPNDIVEMNIICKNTTAIISVRIKGSDEEFNWEFMYYLSETDTAFTETNVGNITEGQYIIMRGINMPKNAVNNFILHIESLSNDTLTVKPMYNSNTLFLKNPKVWKFIYNPNN